MAEPHVQELLDVSLTSPEAKRQLGVTYHAVEAMFEVTVHAHADRAKQLGYTGPPRPRDTESWDAVNALVPGMEDKRLVRDFIASMKYFDTDSWVELSAKIGRGLCGMGKRRIGPATAAQLYRVCVRCGYTPRWQDAEPSWLEGHSRLGRTGINTKPMSKDRIGRLAQLRGNISELELELSRQKALYLRLRDEAKAELEAEMRAFVEEFGEEVPTDPEILLVGDD